jgi:peptidoglycan hydrolase-like protein with peptidoglycan-binding domain
VLVLGRVKDVLDDDERKMKPLSFVLLLGATVLSGMIVFNAFAHQTGKARVATGLPINATTHMDVTVAADPTNTVVLKYDPLVEETQRELLAIGIYQGLVDGVVGQRTKQAIQRYQELNGLQATGEASQDLVNQIRFARKVEAAAKFTGSVAPAGQNTVVTPAPVVAANKTNGLKIKKVQVALAGLGYDINILDGKLNEETHAAILKFEMDNGLAMDGLIDAKLMTALDVAAN